MKMGVIHATATTMTLAKSKVTTPLLCECSRQSVIYSLQCLWKEKHFTVTLCHSIFHFSLFTSHLLPFI